MTTNDLHQQEIFLQARACVGVPFRHQGRNPAYGLDCVGLVVYVMRQLGLCDFDRVDYKKIPDKSAISRHAEAAGFRLKPKPAMGPGDVVIMLYGRYMEHAGILSDRGLIHACEKYGRVVEHGLNDEWRDRILSVYSYPILHINKETE